MVSNNKANLRRILILGLINISNIYSAGSEEDGFHTPRKSALSTTEGACAAAQTPTESGVLNNIMGAASPQGRLASPQPGFESPQPRLLSRDADNPTPPPIRGNVSPAVRKAINKLDNILAEAFEWDDNLTWEPWIMVPQDTPDVAQAPGSRMEQAPTILDTPVDKAPPKKDVLEARLKVIREQLHTWALDIRGLRCFSMAYPEMADYDLNSTLVNTLEGNLPDAFLRFIGTPVDAPLPLMFELVAWRTAYANNLWTESQSAASPKPWPQAFCRALNRIHILRQEMAANLAVLEREPGCVTPLIILQISRGLMESDTNGKLTFVDFLRARIGSPYLRGLRAYLSENNRTQG